MKKIKFAALVVGAFTLFAVAALLDGCGPARQHVTVFPADNYVVYGRPASNIEFYIQKGVSKDRMDKMLRAATVITEEFEKDFGPIGYIQVFVVDADTISCGERVGTFNGCFQVPRGPIRITCGDFDTLPALYHEYVHWMTPGHDVEHEDPRWNSVWEPRQHQIQASLL